MTSTVRTAEYGSVRSVVWEGIGEAYSSPPLSRSRVEDRARWLQADLRREEVATPEVDEA